MVPRSLAGWVMSIGGSDAARYLAWCRSVAWCGFWCPEEPLCPIAAFASADLDVVGTGC